MTFQIDEKRVERSKNSRKIEVESITSYNRISITLSKVFLKVNKIINELEEHIGKILNTS